MSAPGGQGQSGAPQRSGPPYAPTHQSLGGVPDIIPDIPATAVFLFLYVVFAIIHIKIFMKNKARGHKFIFNGALFGFCKIRIITMSLRIAWACYQRNVSLGIAAQVFVYVGTIILFIVNWFFTQRILRAQHPRLGWSKPYRVLHRGAIVCLILCLLMLVVAAIQQFFTLNTNTLRIDRNLQLTGQTYFSAFCFAPIVVLLISAIIPRRGTEKFGAGRLRNNITILIIAVVILSAGQIFRCVTTWLPPKPLRSARGQPLEAPWYFTKACFYVFNFTTEIIVVIFYAIVRVDLRFHIPDGAKKAGDYRTKRDSLFHVDVIGNEKNLKRASSGFDLISPEKKRASCGPNGILGAHPNNSADTLHEYESSLFDDTRTLADSLRYPSSVLEVDPKSGHWKIKRVSQDPSTASFRQSNMSQGSLWDPTRNTWVDGDAPPVPGVPADWPLRESQLPRGSIPVMEHRNQRSSRSAPRSEKSNEIEGHDMNKVDMGNAIEEAIRKLEANSEINKRRPSDEISPLEPPGYDAITPVHKRASVLPPKKAYSPSSQTPPRKYTYEPSPRSSELPKKHDYSATPANAVSDLPKKHNYAPAPVEEPQSPHQASNVSGSTSFDTARAEQEFARFSYEAPSRPGTADRGGNLSESEKEYEKRHKR